MARAKMNDYQGESDAHSLITAKEVQKDPKRMKKALGHVDRLHGEAVKRMAAMKAAKGLKKAFPDGVNNAC